MDLNDSNISHRNITIYGASSPDIDRSYLDAANRLGAAIARAGFGLVSGGGRSGMMAAAIDGALAEGGKTIGVLPRFMVDRGWNHPMLSEMISVETMHERKLAMAQISSAAIALPGGCGTMDELFEIITWRQLGLYQGNVVILNVDGYYDRLVDFIDDMIPSHFMNPDHADLWYVTDDIDDAVAHAIAPAPHRPFSQKLPIGK